MGPVHKLVRDYDSILDSLASFNTFDPRYSSNLPNVAFRLHRMTISSPQQPQCRSVGGWWLKVVGQDAEVPEHYWLGTSWPGEDDTEWLHVEAAHGYSYSPSTSLPALLKAINGYPTGMSGIK